MYYIVYNTIYMLSILYTQSKLTRERQNEGEGYTKLELRGMIKLEREKEVLKETLRRRRR